MVIFYILEKFFYSITDFLYHWYVLGFFRWWKITIDILRESDRILAVRINLIYWFKPFYQDYTFLGLALGFIFRTTKIIFGSIFYLVVFIIASIILLIWFAVLPVIIYKIFNSF